MSVSVVNRDTNYIMERALQLSNIEDLPAWPGRDVEFVIKDSEDGIGKELDLEKSEAAFALLGQPLQLRISCCS